MRWRWVWWIVAATHLAVAQTSDDRPPVSVYIDRLGPAANAEDPAELSRAHADAIHAAMTRDDLRQITVKAYSGAQTRSKERIEAHVSGAHVDVPVLAAAAIADGSHRIEDAERTMKLAFGGDPIAEETRGYAVLSVASIYQTASRSDDVVHIINRLRLDELSDWERAWLSLMRGQSLLNLGDYVSAMSDGNQAELLATSVDDEHLSIEVAVLRSSVAHQLGDTATCLKVTDEFLDRPSVIGNPSKHGRLACNRALALEQSGSLENALPLLEEALGDSNLAKDSDETTKLCVHAGRVARRLGLHARARKHLQAVRDDSNAFGVSRAGALEGLALVDFAEGRLEDAEREALGAESEYRGLRDMAQSVTKNALLSVLNTRLKIAIARPDAKSAESLVDEGMTLLDEVEMEKLSPSEMRGLRSRFVEWAEDAQDAISLAIEVADDDEDEAGRLIQLGFECEERFKAKSLLASIARHARASATLPAAPSDVLGNLMTTLARDDLFVEYANGTSNAFAYRAYGSEITRIPLGPRKEFESPASLWLDLLAPNDRLGDTEEIVALGASLYRTLLVPVLPPLDDKQQPARIVVCPTESLTTVPFHALVSDDSTDPKRRILTARFVLDRFPVVYTPSAAVFAALTNAPKRAIDSALVLAAPAPARDDASAPTGISKLRELKNTLGEAKAIESAFASKNVSPRVFTGADATVDRFLTEAPNASFIALLCHGFADPFDPAGTGLILAASDRECGWLSLSRVSELSLKAELSILSACSTADGALVRGEGALSMSYAFLASGSRSVIATLWTVDDRWHAELMIQFNRAVAKGAPAALRESQLFLRQGKSIDGGGTNSTRGPGIAIGPDPGSSSEPIQSHPHYWAAPVWVGR